MTEVRTENQAVIDMMERHTPLQELEPGKIYLIQDTDGRRRIIDTDDYADSPRYMQRAKTVNDAESLVTYINSREQHHNGVEVWINPGTHGETPKVRAVLDSNARNSDTCRIAFNATPEWAAWNEINDHLMSQGEFAEFVEQWVDTIVKPDGATMLEIAQSLRANVGVTFKSQKRLANGQTQFEYTENVDASAGTAGDITIPDDMELVVCPFYGAKVYKVRAKFRYRVNSGKLSMGVRLLNTEKVVEAVLADVESVIREGLPDVTVLHGE